MRTDAAAQRGPRQETAHPAGGHEPEFAAWRWETMENLPALVVPFKRQVYERVVREFARLV